MFGFIMGGKEKKKERKKKKFVAHRSVFGKSRNILRAEKILSVQERPCIKEPV